MQTEAMHNEENAGVGQMPQNPVNPHVGEDMGDMPMGSNILGDLDNYDLTWNQSPDMQSPFSDNILSENTDFDFDTNNCTDIDNKCSPVPRTWALSPYGELEHIDYIQTSPNPPTPTPAHQEPVKLMQQKNMSHLIIPQMERQSSLNMAIEVLGSNEDEEEFCAESPIPTPFTEDAHVSHFSPMSPASTSRHRNISWGGVQATAITTSTRIRAVSEDATAFANYPVDLELLLNDPVPTITYCTETEQQETDTNANNNNAVVTSADETGCSQTVNVQATTSAYAPAPEVYNEVQMTRESSFNLQLALDQLQPVTEEVEVLETFGVTTIEITDIQPATPDTVVVDLTEDDPSTSSAASSTPMKRTTSYKRKRSRNNEACRESRKKRKVQREENEEKVQELIVDNENLRRKIEELEVEVKETRATLLTKMTGKKAGH